MGCNYILVADDHPRMLEEAYAALETFGCTVVRVESGEALVQAAEQRCPDVVVTDISIPGMSGFKATEEIQKRKLSVRVIFLTVHSASGYVRKARQLGADGYVLKIEDFENLPEAVAAVLAGKTYFSPQLSATAGYKI